MTRTTGVLVVGSEGGIGAACVEILEQRGYAVVGIDRGTGIDVTKPQGAERALERAEDKLGQINGVVHAVGMSGRSIGDGPVSECTDEGWSEVFRVNAESVFRLLRASLRRLPNHASIVVIGSVLAQTLDRDFLTAAYAASKNSVEALVRLAAFEGAARDIRVNCVAVGLAATRMSQRALSDAGILARLNDLQPLGGRAISPTEVAETVAFLLSPGAAAITGSTIPTDRGWMLR